MAQQPRVLVHTAKPADAERAPATCRHEDPGRAGVTTGNRSTAPKEPTPRADREVERVAHGRVESSSAGARNAVQSLSSCQLPLRTEGGAAQEGAAGGQDVQAVGPG